MRYPWLAPLPAGGRARDRVVAGIAAVTGIALVALLCSRIPQPVAGLGTLVAPMGASAVLVFAVPASPLSQPWPAIAGNVLSAAVGAVAAHAIPNVPLAAGVAVGGAIVAMSLLRCLHPPGGAAALTAVVGGPAVHAAGLFFAVTVVLPNALVLVAAGWLFHRVSGQSYPHRPAPVTGILHRDDIAVALAEMGESFDIATEDLEALLQRAEAAALRRQK